MFNFRFIITLRAKCSSLCLNWARNENLFYHFSVIIVLTQNWVMSLRYGAMTRGIVLRAYIHRRKTETEPVMITY